MAMVLVYHVRDAKKLLAIRLELARMAVPVREVEDTELTHPLGYLLGYPGYAPGLPGAVEPFREEMLVLDGLRGPGLSRFLDALRAHGASVALKAVVTEHNVNWSSLQLYRELKCEHERMTAGKKSVHKGN